MKNLLLLLSCIFVISPLLSQQSGMIKYTENIQLELDLPEGIELSGMMDNGLTTNKELHFNQSQSVYIDSKNNEDGDTEMASDDGAIQIKIKRDDTEEIYFTDFTAKSVLHQDGFMGKEFLITKPLERTKWKIHPDRIKYLDYVCQKATVTLPTNEKDENGNPVNEEVVAWFSSEIPVAIGPDSYNQLPGAVLMVSVDDGRKEIKATEVLLGDTDPNILKAPSKGKKVTTEEFQKIVEEKTKELEKMSGGRHIMIRG